MIHIQFLYLAGSVVFIVTAAMVLRQLHCTDRWLSSLLSYLKWREQRLGRIEACLDQINQKLKDEQR